MRPGLTKLSLAITFVIAATIAGYQFSESTKSRNDLVDSRKVNKTTVISTATEVEPSSPLETKPSVDSPDKQSTKPVETAHETTQLIAAEKPLEPAFSPQDTGFDYDVAIQSIETLLTKVELSAEDEAKLFQLQDQLVVISSIDPAIRTKLIQLVKTDLSSRIGQVAFSALAQLNNPDVVELGFELTDSAENNAIVAGLQLLSSGRTQPQRTFAVTENLINIYRDDDPQIVLEALHAIPLQKLDVETGERANSLLADLASHEDSAVRSASLFGLAQKASDASMLLPAIQALSSPERDDRMSAVMALGQTAIVSDEIKAQLMMRVDDASEIWEVRRIAADTLNRFELTNEEDAILAAFRQEQLKVSQGKATQ